MRDYATSIFTDGLKTETGPGSGVFSNDLGTSVSLKAAYYMHSFSSGNLCNQDDCLENWTAFLRPSVIDVYVDSFSAHVIVLGE